MCNHGLRSHHGGSCAQLEQDDEMKRLDTTGQRAANEPEILWDTKDLEVLYGETIGMTETDQQFRERMRRKWDLINLEAEERGNK